MLGWDWAKLKVSGRARRIGLKFGLIALASLGILALIWFYLEPPAPSRPPITGPAHPKPPPAIELTFEEMFRQVALRHNLDWRIIEALAYRESNMDHLAVGISGEYGLMQILPSTWEDWAPRVGVDDPFDPYSNIRVGAAYLSFMRDLCASRGHSEPHCMVLAYHWGPNRLEQFFAAGGTWEQVPELQRHYATEIVQLSATRRQNAALYATIYQAQMSD